MKKCPECRREYDATMMFCLDDGAELLYGPASGSSGDAATLILPNSSSADQAVTRAQMFTTDKTAIFPSGVGEATKSKSLDKRLLLAPFVLAAIVLGGFVGYRYFSANTAHTISSIAVLPFEDRSGNAESDYLIDGLTESLIYRLSQLPDLKVSPRSSVFRYKGTETDPRVVAKELGVDSVMTGHITQRGENLSISVELVDVRNDRLLWGEQYDRKLSDLLTAQREMVVEIVSKLELKLSGDSQQKLAKKFTDNNEAYQLYLKGRYHWNKREIKEFQKAVEFFRQAIDKDPNYALAYSGLADTFSLYEAYGDFRAKDYMPLAKQAALKALELDPNLAAGHASLGVATLHWDYDWEGADRSFRRAIELDPKYATAHLWYGELLSLRGKHDEALAEISKAIEYEPFSFIFNRQKVKCLVYAGRYDEALSQNKTVNELFPNDSRFHSDNGLIHETQRNYARAFEEYWLSTKADKGAEPAEAQAMKDAYDRGGWEGFQKRAQERFLQYISDDLELDKNRYVPAVNYATAYGYGKDKEKTLEYLNKALDERSMAMLYLKVTPQYFFLHDDTRFKELVRKVGIPE